jgi:hypothetical protein
VTGTLALGRIVEWTLMDPSWMMTCLVACVEGQSAMSVRWDIWNCEDVYNVHHGDLAEKDLTLVQSHCL